MLELRSTSRTCRVVEEVFRRVASGIQHSAGFTARAMLEFIHGVLNNSVPQLADKQKCVCVFVCVCMSVGRAGRVGGTVN